MKRPPLIHSQRENNAYQVKADHMREVLPVVKSIGLREPMSFLSMNFPIKIELECNMHVMSLLLVS